ncbi:MAG: hypothetical protein HXX16_02420 [Bacteroidales bacterium]|nr:hypothetical protein [Bacteroidales bacterium]
MTRRTILIVAVLFACFSLKAYSQTLEKDKDIDVSTIIQVAQREYYVNNNYDKAMAILSKAAKYLGLKNDSKYQEIVDVNWFQIKFTLLEKGAISAQPLVENLMKGIEAYHANLSNGFSFYDNAVNLMLSDNISKHFIYYPNGIQVIGSMLDSFIKIYQEDFLGEQNLRMFQNSKSYIDLLNGDVKSALSLLSEIMEKADEYEKDKPDVNYGHALFFSKQGVEKAIEQYKGALKLDEEFIAKSLLMDFQTLRQYNLDVSGLKNYENQVRTNYVKKFYKRPYITEIKNNSEAEKVGLKVGDIIELYNNDLVYDIEMFGIERMSERFKQNLKSREVKVLRNGTRLTFTVTPGLLGVYMDYEK